MLCPKLPCNRETLKARDRRGDPTWGIGWTLKAAMEILWYPETQGQAAGRTFYSAGAAPELCIDKELLTQSRPGWHRSQFGLTTYQHPEGLGQCTLPNTAHVSFGASLMRNPRIIHSLPSNIFDSNSCGAVHTWLRTVQAMPMISMQQMNSQPLCSKATAQESHGTTASAAEPR